MSKDEFSGRMFTSQMGVVMVQKPIDEEGKNYEVIIMSVTKMNLSRESIIEGLATREFLKTTG
jgi:hypothetical protein